MKHSLSLLFILLSAGITGCNVNVFDSLDSPTGDAQIKSAARACFDQGDLVCARDLYGQLSQDSYDVKESELAFASLDEAGASMGTFMEAFGDGSGAKGLTRLANKLRDGADGFKRSKIFDAFSRAKNITNNPELRGVVRFATAVALIATTLAETRSFAGDGNSFTAADLVIDPTNCKAQVLSTCDNVVCNPPPGGFIGTESAFGSPGLDASGAEAIVKKSTPSLAVIDGAISEVVQALSNEELGASGKFSDGTGSFARTIANSSKAYAFDATTQRRCFRWLLVSNGVGTE